MKNYEIRYISTDELYVKEGKEEVSVDSEGKVVMCVPYLGDGLWSCHYSDVLYAKEI